MSALAKIEPEPQRGLTPSELLSQALQSGAGIETMERLMAMHDQWEARQAQRQFLQAFASFKDQAVKVVRSRLITDGPLKGKRHADLHGIVSAVTGPLSENGLSATWQITRDEPEWIAVRCTVRHVGGHSEHVEMGGPPDKGGAKNAVQARASTVTYLERYTLKAALGLAEEDDDDDGLGGHSPAEPQWLLDWTAKIQDAATLDELQAIGAEMTVANDAQKRRLRPIYYERKKELECAA